MKKLLFTIVGLLQVMLVMAKEPTVRNVPANSQPIQKTVINTVNKQALYQKANKAWLIVDVEGTMPNGRIPASKGIYEPMPDIPLQVK